MPEILENRESWRAHYEANFLKHYRETGETNFKIYSYARIEEPVPGKAVNLSESRLLLISSAGGYLKDSQEAFDAPNLLGDYSIRTFPMNTPLDTLAFAHEHYDHTAINADVQTLIPLRHLEDLQSDGIIGSLAESVVSFSGYHPDVTQVMDVTMPQILEIAQKEQAQAALLVPS